MLQVVPLFKDLIEEEDVKTVCVKLISVHVCVCD